MTDIVHFKTPADMRTVCGIFVAAKSPMIVLAAGAAAGRLNLMAIPSTRHTLPSARLERMRGPTVVMLADYDEPEGPRPQDWKSATRLRHWLGAAGAVVINGTEGEPDLYRDVIELAGRCGRLALIETVSARVDVWADFMRCSRTILLRPEGGHHATASTAEVLH